MAANKEESKKARGSRQMAEAERHISREELFPFVHYEYGEAYYGSCKGLRYRIAREPLQNVHFTPVPRRMPLRSSGIFPFRKKGFRKRRHGSIPWCEREDSKDSREPAAGRKAAFAVRL